jgi:hypothetical protein
MEVLLIATKRDFEAEISGVTGIGRYARSVYEGLSRLVQVEKYPVFDYSSFLSSLITTLKGIPYFLGFYLSWVFSGDFKIEPLMTSHILLLEIT